MDIKNKLRSLLFESVNNKGVGVLIKADNTNKVLLLKRCCAPHANTWSMLSGGIDSGENKLEALKREIMEEIQIEANDKLELNYQYSEDDGKYDFSYYKGTTKEEFTPTLNNENLEFGWFSVDELPEPLYPKILNKIKEICKK